MSSFTTTETADLLDRFRNFLESLDRPTTTEDHSR